MVLRPALYDLAVGENLRELIAMSGGLLPQAYTGRAQITRVLPPEQRQPGGHDRLVIDVDLRVALAAGASAVTVEPNDRISVFPVTTPVRDQVTIRGSVWRPGNYQIEQGTRLSAMLARAGGLKPETYLDRAHISRLMPDSSRRLLQVDLTGMHTVGAPGGSATAPGSPADDPEIQEYDEITVFSRADFRPARQVGVYGSVQRPGLLLFRDSMTVRDAVMLAGGLRDEAYLLEAEVSRLRDGGDPSQLATVIKVPLDSSYVVDATGYGHRPTAARGQEPLLQPYDNVFIRRVPGWESQRLVVISGEVRFPGRYALTQREERLSDVLERAGGLTPSAYVAGAQFYRADSRAGRVGIDLARVLHEAVPADSASAPSLTLNGGAGILAGVVVGLVLALFRERLRRPRPAVA